MPDLPRLIARKGRCQDLYPDSVYVPVKTEFPPYGEYASESTSLLPNIITVVYRVWFGLHSQLCFARNYQLIRRIS